MAKFEFKFMRVIVNDSFEVEAETQAEAFVKLVNDWNVRELPAIGNDVVVRDYVATGDGDFVFPRMLEDVDWDACDFDRKQLAPEYFGRMYAAKLGKYHSSVYDWRDIRRAFEEYKGKTGWRGLDAENAIESFIRFVEKGA